MHQIKQHHPEQHAAETDIANHAIIHLLGYCQHLAPAAGIDEGERTLDDKNQGDSDRKYLPEIHLLSRSVRRALTTRLLGTPCPASWAGSAPLHGQGLPLSMGRVCPSPWAQKTASSAPFVKTLKPTVAEVYHSCRG
jgi:hypothetical protein